MGTGDYGLHGEAGKDGEGFGIEIMGFFNDLMTICAALWK